MRKTWAKAGAVGLTAWLLAAVVIGHRIRVPDYRRALRQAKIRKTVAALEDTSDAIERYARERGRYPQAQSVADLASELEPRFIEHLQRADAWDKPLRYAARCENRWCYDYRLYSEGGRDNAAISEKNLFSLGDMQVRMPGRWPPAYQPSTADQSLPEGVIIYGAGCLLVVPRDARDGPGEMQ